MTPYKHINATMEEVTNACMGHVNNCQRWSRCASVLRCEKSDVSVSLASSKSLRLAVCECCRITCPRDLDHRAEIANNVLRFNSVDLLQLKTYKAGRELWGFLFRRQLQIFSWDSFHVVDDWAFLLLVRRWIPNKIPLCSLTHRNTEVHTLVKMARCCG